MMLKLDNLKQKLFWKDVIIERKDASKIFLWWQYQSQLDNKKYYRQVGLVNTNNNKNINNNPPKAWSGLAGW